MAKDPRRIGRFLLILVVLLLFAVGYFVYHTEPFIAQRLGQKASRRFCTKTEVSFLFSHTAIVILRGGQDFRIDERIINEFLQATPEIIKLEIDLPKIRQVYYNDRAAESSTAKKISYDKIEMPAGMTRDVNHKDLFKVYHFSPEQHCRRN